MTWTNRPPNGGAWGKRPPIVPAEGAFNASDFSSDFDIGVPGFEESPKPTPAYGKITPPTPDYITTTKPLPAWGKRTPNDGNWS